MLLPVAAAAGAAAAAAAAAGGGRVNGATIEQASSAKRGRFWTRTRWSRRWTLLELTSFRFTCGSLWVVVVVVVVVRVCSFFRDERGRVLAYVRVCVCACVLGGGRG